MDEEVVNIKNQIRENKSLAIVRRYTRIKTMAKAGKQLHQQKLSLSEKRKQVSTNLPTECIIIFA